MSTGRKFDKNKYDEYVDKYIRISEEMDRTIPYSELKSYNLPDGRWLVVNCPDKSVDTWAKFVAWCGFSSDGLTKEQVIKLVLRKANEFNRPLMYNDFRGHGCYNVSFGHIKKHFGTMNKMKEELGLEIIQPQMIKVTQEIFDNNINLIKEYLDKENRNFITFTEWSSLKIDNLYSYQSLNRFTKENYNISLKEYLLAQGIKTGEAGEGLSHTFYDGEITTSQFEYMFSSFLRKCGLRCNVDYFRNVRYSTFCDGYNGMRDCDYVINYNDNIIYVEIAGIIGQYKIFYYEDKPIKSSKSKENYRQKLKEKEELLNFNNCIYFILFPCDLTEENMKQVFENPTVELRKQIESFNQTNIDFVNVRKLGKLDYSNPAVVRHSDWEKHRQIPLCC